MNVRMLSTDTLEREIKASHARIAELEAALREIAAGEIDKDGNVRMRQDSMQIAHQALYPQRLI